jgi:hypothetical protein
MAIGRVFVESTRTAVWKKVTTTLRTAPSLAPVKTWFLNDGDPKRDGRAWSAGDLPALEVSVGCGPGRWIDEADHTTTLVFTHRLGIAGSRQADLLDFWAAIEAAWFPAGNALLDAIQGALAWQVTITGPVPEIRRVDGVVALHGTGIIVVNMDIRT